MFKNINKKLFIVLLFSLVLFLVFLILFFYFYFWPEKEQTIPGGIFQKSLPAVWENNDVVFAPSLTEGSEKSADKYNCVSKTEERIVRGDSLSGLIESGAIVKILFGYYGCNEIKREDVVVYGYAGNKDPLIKIVKGISGDKFHLEKIPSTGSRLHQDFDGQAGQAGWNILINDEILKNSKGEEYFLSEQGHRMLSLYENDYRGIIPANAYLLLGNVASGSLDASRFGLVDKSDILGKAEF